MPAPDVVGVASTRPRVVRTPPQPIVKVLIPGSAATAAALMDAFTSTVTLELAGTVTELGEKLMPRPSAAPVAVRLYDTAEPLVFLSVSFSVSAYAPESAS